MTRESLLAPLAAVDVGGSLFGLSILALALGAAAATVVRTPRLPLSAGLLVALVEPALLMVGAVSCGFRWHGEPVETAATLAGALAALALAPMLVRRVPATVASTDGQG